MERPLTRPAKDPQSLHPEKTIITAQNQGQAYLQLLVRSPRANVTGNYIKRTHGWCPD